MGNLKATLSLLLNLKAANLETRSQRQLDESQSTKNSKVFLSRETLKLQTVCARIIMRYIVWGNFPPGGITQYLDNLSLYLRGCLSVPSNKFTYIAMRHERMHY
jgi:hypothetical protein